MSAMHRSGGPARRLAAMAMSVAVLCGAFGVAPAVAAAPRGSGAAPISGMSHTVVAQGVPDECWIPPSDPHDPSDYGHYDNPSGYGSNGGVICPSGSEPKVNQGYVWGITRTGDDLWFGTVANAQCLVKGGDLGETTPMMTSAYTCEFGSSPYVANYGIPPAEGDWRPPQLYEYDMYTQSLVNLATSQTAPGAGSTISNYLAHTLGIRSAGEAVDPNTGNTVIIFAGPTLKSNGGINMLAFDQNGTFLAATTLTAYNDIRSWVTIPASGDTPEQLYAGVNVINGFNPYGAILRWNPLPGNPENYFNFTRVGTTKSAVAYLAAASDRMYATTWPNSRNLAGLYVSPVSSSGRPDGALTGGAWKELWQASNYEPDPITAATYDGGALAVFDGYVYWGTMHVPMAAADRHIALQDDPTEQQIHQDIVGSRRAISLFRLPVGGTKVQLLYGDAQLPAYNQSTQTWQVVNNNMGGVAGLYGPSGFGDQFNNYAWSMTIFGGQLYVGTMNWSYLAPHQTAGQQGLAAGTAARSAAAGSDYGAQLFAFPSADQAAQTVFTGGVGNYLNYGIRNMVSVESGTTSSSEYGLYLGMANPMNLATQGPDQGGWNVIQATSGTASVKR